MNLRILHADHDEGEWLDLWARSGREPFAHPAYCRLFTGPADAAVLALVGEGSSSALFPLVLRGREGLPWLTAAGRFVDATSPYGYGGPFGGDLDLGRCLETLGEWAAEEELGSVFLRLSLGSPAPPGDARDARAQVVDTADNVVVDLQRTAEEIWSGYEHKVRKNVKKSIRLGCTAERDDSLDRLDDFLAVYSSTMTRRNAPEWYRFDRPFFARIAAELRGSYSTFYVRDADGEVVSVELVLESDRSLYSFLGGTLEKAFYCTPNDLLKHTVIEYGRGRGLDGFVLGGGATPGDGIFRYKRSFCPGGVRPFRTARIVPDPDRYARWVAERASWAPLPDGSGFFPGYRAPANT